MATENQHNDPASYAAAVRAELADLPPEEREALLEDLEDHLAEVAAESDTPLTERLGTPQAYAAELRLAYGATGAERPRGIAPLRRARDLAMALGGSRSYRAVRDFLPELRPAWWVLRAYLAVLVLAFLFRGGQGLRPIPNPFTRRGLLEIVAMAVAVVFSVRLGRRGAPFGRTGLWFLRVSNVGVGLAGVLALTSMGTPSYSLGQPQPLYSSGGYRVFPDAYAIGPVTNLYPYSLDGKPLDGVLLYDQDGRPYVLGGKGYGGVLNQYPMASDGQPITNLYPLKQTRLPDGSAVPAPRVALPPVARPAPSPSPSPSPSA